MKITISKLLITISYIVSQCKCELTCGKSIGDAKSHPKARIVEGQNADEHEYPWAVFLVVGQKGRICGATLIARRWILTAVHCVKGFSPEDLRPYVGCHKIMDCLSNSRPLVIEKIFEHPDFKDNFVLSNDIALLKLKSPGAAVNNRNVMPACLPSQPITESGTIVTVIGWGATSDELTGAGTGVLQETTLITKSDKSCEYEIDGNITFCARGGPGNSCRGDSGGFVGRMVNGKWEVSGIVSFGAEPCSQRDNFMAEVYYFNAFIVNTINKNS